MIGKVFFGITVVLFCLGIVVAGNHYGAADTSPNASAHVKVQLESGHGSATHIGNGYFLTAAHVVTDNEIVELKSDDGKTFDATVLWVNAKYDIALMYVAETKVASVDVECRTPGHSEDLSLRGNPLNAENITTWGKVAGSIREIGPWLSVIPVNAAIAPGMSGGGVFDEDGELVGVNVGVMVMPVGFAGGPVSLAYVVPAETVCYLMGK